MVQGFRHDVQFDILSPPAARLLETDSVDDVSGDGVPAQMLPPVSDVGGQVAGERQFDRRHSAQFDEGAVGLDETVVETQERVRDPVQAPLAGFRGLAEGNLLFEDRTLWAFEDEGEAALGCAYVQNGVLRAVESAVNENGEEEVRPVILRVDGPDFSLPPGFEVVSFSEGIFVLSNGENVGYYSLEGKWTADPVYLAGGAFREGLAVVQNVDGMYGVIDSKGNEQIPCVFSYLCPFSDGVSVLYSDETGWQAVYKVRGVFGERGDDKPPIVTERPFVTRIPVSRNSESGRSDDEIYIFPSVVPPRRTTVPEWTQRPRPTVSVPGTTSTPDPTEPQTGEKPTTDAPPATQPPDPTEPSNQPGGGSGPQAPNPGQEVGF